MVIENHNDINKISSKRNGIILLYKGYSYVVRKKDELKTFWRCRNRKCSGKIITDNLDNIIEETLHNHTESFGENESLFANHLIKNRSVNTSESSRDIVINTIKNMSTEGVFSANKYENLINIVSKTRKSRGIFNNTETPDIAKSLKRTIKGEGFYLYDSGVNSNERIIILSTKKKFISFI
ncbi:hypothetical protein DMUE_0920 [Dictyocoela muelleri]|nr:hypothetical protein DMUE_0920 [Dictyocoela muelleri]